MEEIIVTIVISNEDEDRAGVKVTIDTNSEGGLLDFEGTPAGSVLVEILEALGMKDE